MKKIFLFSLLLSGLAMFACKKAEVIPAPTSSADLKIHFQGVINGSDVEWTKNVNGYFAESSKVYTNQPGSNLLDLAYYCGMISNSKNSSIQVGLGSLVQDPSLGTSPTLATLKAFMTANMTPNYSDTAKVGFEVRYTDENGKLFRSDETAPGTVEFFDLVEKEDNNGEYIQFRVEFSCLVNHWGKSKLTPITDSIYESALIQNATFIGYYTR